MGHSFLKSYYMSADAYCFEYRRPQTNNFFHPPSQPNSLHPHILINYIDGGIDVVAALPNLATTPNGAYHHRKSTIVNPPNCLCAAHVTTAVLAAIVETKLQDAANRSNLLHPTCWRWPIRGCGHHCLQPHCCCNLCYAIHVIVKLLVINITNE